MLRTLRPALTHDAEHAHQVLHRALNASCVMARVEEVAAALRVPGRSTQVLDTILDHFAGLLADPAAIRDVLRRHAVNDTVHRRYTDDQAVERYILGLVTALGYTKSISSFGAWLYSAYRSTWTPRVNDALKAFLAACDTLGALEARRAHHLHAENTPIAHRVVRVFDELPPDFRGAPRSGTSDGPTTIDELSPSAVPGPGPTARTGPDRPDPPRQRPAPPRGDPPPDAAIGLATSAVSDDPDASAPTHTDPAPADTRTAATTTGTSPAPTPGGPTARARPPTRGLRRPAPAAPSDDLVAAHLGAAVAALPHLSRHGPMDNADFRRQLVRVYLARQPVVPAPGTDEIDPSDEHGPTSQRSSHPDVIAASSA